ncbi:Protein SLOW WALKER 1 [Striga hermonthica]|uniref:Protein SLOW WALKER 1 n=1 Tax=Striga hermonthica TaxID=68872 RepID=A0A9N7NBI6_STRHE|nr:Protein SLOW WALKER 1 [Striga hermonthica]
MAETFPVKPKLRPTSSKATLTPESKYWRSFKIPKDIETTPAKSFVYPINSISFSPVAPHDFAAAHSASVSIFSGQTLDRRSTISNFSDTVASVSFRRDGKLLAAGDLTGTVHVIDARSRGHLRRLKGHSAAARLVRYPRAADKTHLFSGGDDSVVKYWDVTAERCQVDLLGHKDYVRCGDTSPENDSLFVSGSYDHRIKLWDVRSGPGGNTGSVMELDHGKPVESVIYLPSGSLIATAGGNFMKIWDVIGGGKLLYSMESHNKTVTSLCLGKFAKTGENEDGQHRILSVSLDGYLKTFDYSKFKITHTMRFPEPLLSVGFSPDCSTRVVGTSKGNLYIGRKKMKMGASEDLNSRMVWKGIADNDGKAKRKFLRPSHFRYFNRGQNLKPSEADYLIKRPKKVKFAEHDKLLKKFRHKEALVAALGKRNPENVVAVMEELVARKKLLKCVSNVDSDELGLLLGFLQKYSTMPRYSGFLTKLANKVVESRAEDIRSSDELMNCIRNLKRDVEEEIRVQQSLLELQGIISPMLRIAAKR